MLTRNQTLSWKLNNPSDRKEVNTMPSPLGDGQTVTLINHNYLGEVQTDTPINRLYLGEVQKNPSPVYHLHHSGRSMAPTWDQTPYSDSSILSMEVPSHLPNQGVDTAGPADRRGQNS